MTLHNGSSFPQDRREQERFLAKVAKRKPLLIASVAAASVLILAGVYFGASKRHAKQVSHAPAIPEKSIAVLPFENRSEEKANAYFAEGIQDEILTRLSKIADLKVISRTSTQHYKSAPENLPEIARQLGVAHILEGSVQKIGDAVRVNVQLINAATDSHLWADTFDRKLTDIFSVESEVAKAIADQLRAKLTGQEKQVIAARPTDNPDAYDAYLRGLAYTLKAATTPANSLAAQKYLKEAVRVGSEVRSCLGAAVISLTPATTSHRIFNQRSPCVKRHGRQPKRRSLFSRISAKPYWPRDLTTTPA